MITKLLQRVCNSHLVQDQPAYQIQHSIMCMRFFFGMQKSQCITVIRRDITKYIYNIPSVSGPEASIETRMM